MSPTPVPVTTVVAPVGTEEAGCMCIRAPVEEEEEEEEDEEETIADEGVSAELEERGEMEAKASKEGGIEEGVEGAVLKEEDEAITITVCESCLKNARTIEAVKSDVESIA